MGEVQLFLGIIPWSLYSSIFLAIGVITYAYSIYSGQKIIDDQRLPVIKNLVINSLEKNFIVLGLAGLFSEMIRGIILNFVSIYIPTSSDPFSGGLMGSLVGLIGALIILAIVIIYMDRKLKASQSENRP